ncbi:MAG: hypothetical protein IKG35_04995, partial [Erysipelotrichaceae bacterium]|nr:hypothetical protein [Erysipelotrichaceae bacterium]
MAWKKRKKQNNAKPEVIDVEARVIPDVEETLREEPRMTETEELKLNQSIVSDILKESAEQSFEAAEEAAETVAENAEPVVEEVRQTVTETAENAETAFEEVRETVEDTAEHISNEVRLEPAEEESFREDTAEIPVVAPVEEISEETENAATEEVQEETAGETAEPAEQTAETSEEYTDETIVYDGAGSLTIADPGETREVSTFDGDSVEKSDSMAKGKKEKKAKKVKVKKDRLGFNWFFWLSFIVLMVPVCFFLYLLYSAAQETHTPIIGERINTEIIHMIDEDQKAAVES